LKALGRDHTAQEALAALEVARTIFPGKVSFDMIFGRPGQTSTSWERELRDVFSVADDHLSIYQLSLEVGTPLWRHYQHVNEKKSTAQPSPLWDRIKATDQIPDEDTLAMMYHLTNDMAALNGFQRYEVSSYARTEAAESKHNLSYWFGLDHIGVGPGAHGCFQAGNAAEVSAQKSVRQRTIRYPSLESYMSSCEQRSHGIARYEHHSLVRAQAEMVAMGLRTRYGVCERRFRALSAPSKVMGLDSFLNQNAVQELMDGGFLQWSSAPLSNFLTPYETADEHAQQHKPSDLSRRLLCTDRGMTMLNDVLPRILPDF
jgi:coproporphyrinogen III oxidase-like Fe-S oxidoreductase